MKEKFLSLEEFIKKEKEKARKLRQTRWWRRQLEKGVCYYCGKEVGAKNLTMDHKIPLSRWGTSDRINIVPCCKECNNKKKYLLPWEWEEYVKRLKITNVEEG
ncbi:HNH endonuclease [Thermodesulfobacterium sp. TA1]|uniref:HNH endonuclease n=1 Tax=Thermodesulfobacterium sp. TA1 TaxID=2234087 RepID=UPI001231AF8C|nr:HNH endonuclease [Thermodesulfobacterium sp. TA1]QER41961.1 HNH endonuclease [Thermodesulfobacterium sp. TA1]